MGGRPYTTATLAEEWGCSERLIRNLVASGELRAFKLGEKLIRIPPEAAEEYMRCRNTASPASGESGPSQYGTEAGDPPPAPPPPPPRGRGARRSRGGGRAPPPLYAGQGRPQGTQKSPRPSQAYRGGV